MLPHAIPAGKRQESTRSRRGLRSRPCGVFGLSDGTGNGRDNAGCLFGARCGVPFARRGVTFTPCRVILALLRRCGGLRGLRGTIGGVPFTGLSHAGGSSRLAGAVRGGFNGTLCSRHALTNGFFGFADALHNVTSGLVNAPHHVINDAVDAVDSSIRDILHDADNLVQTGLLTVLRVENTRHRRFNKKHDITGTRLAIPIDKKQDRIRPVPHSKPQREQ